MLPTNSRQELLAGARGLGPGLLRSLPNSVLDLFENHCSIHGKALLLLAFTLYLASRVFVFYLMIGGDVRIYAQYAYQARAAHLENTTIYQKFYSDRDMNRAIEYPPLAVELITFMSVFIPTNTDFTEFYTSFNRIFHCILFLSDLLTLVILLICLFKHNIKISTILLTVTSYTLTGFVLGHFLYSRLDLVLGELIILAIVLMTSFRKLELLSFAVLSFAIAFKIVPILLLPIWLIGALYPMSSNSVWIVWQLVKKGALLGLIIILPWIFFEEDSLLFLGVHQLRGIHIESLWGTIAVLLSKLGLAVTVTSFRSIDVAFSLSSAFTKLSQVLLVSGSLLIYLIYAYKALPLITTHRMRSSSISQEDPTLFKLTILTSLVFSLAVSKVLSPQYFLLFVPFALLIPWELSWGKLSHLILLLLAFLTTLIVPIFYVSDVLQMTWFGVALLSVRNIGMVVWAGILLFHLARYRAEGRCLSVPNHL